MKYLITAVLLLCSPVWARTFYVSLTDGNDIHCTGSGRTPYLPGGTHSCPWKTIANVNRRLFSPGDSILFKKGETWGEGLVPPSSGTKDRPITIGAYGSGAQPTITGADLMVGWSLYTGAIYRAFLKSPPRRVWNGDTELKRGSRPELLTKNQFYWESNYLYIRTGYPPDGQKIEVTVRAYPLYVRRSFLVIDGLHLTKANEMNIISATEDNDHVTIQNCTIDHAGLSGIFLYGDTATIAHWTFLHNTIAHNGSTIIKGIAQDHGIYVSHSSSNVLEGNVWDDNLGFGIQLQDDSNDNIVRYNYFHANRAGALTIWDNTGRSFPTRNSVFSNVMNGDTVGIMIGGSASKTSNIIVNNTIYGYISAGLSIHDNANFGIFKNNILFSPNGGIYALYDNSGSAQMISDHNIVGPTTSHVAYWHGTKYRTLSGFVAATGLDSHSLSADPKLSNPSIADFTLLPNSPAVHSGFALGSPFNVGLDPRTTLPWRVLHRNSWDIGAFVYLPQ